MKHPKIFKTTKDTSYRMSKVHLKGGKAETYLAKILWHRGIRYRKNYAELPGSPDIAITSQKVAIFVDGEFWHGKDWEVKKKRLSRNREYWIQKIEENMDRDKRDDMLLRNEGWTVLHFWEKDVLRNPEYCTQVIAFFLNK
ncbi:very short patch repair endonuclease [Lactiplantibacillus plantarum]|uniref:very short patch repair endonuclease n=1 Tax=Lactiplantibacillus plantarum TaxID=1590 RepID=UPI000D20B4DE|nr:very short patch repair endonuclease [Lactiplantibacillus plantarum]AVW03479.1 very short patch repair endonuclease [Lactiplantibacillus plantarum]